MTVGAALLLYVAGVGTLGPRVLGRTGWTARAPLLGIVTYLAAVWSVIAALGLAGLTLAVHATALGGGLSHLIGACVLRLRATYATPGGATVAGLGLALTGAVVARTAVTAVRHLRATGRQATRHAQTARLVGVHQPALGAVLLEHPQPAAYCVAVRPTVVLTTGALQALSPDQLQAVLAHERAHLTGHHHRLLAMVRIARQILPFLPLTRDADVQVARLIELHADDAATRTQRFRAAGRRAGRPGHGGRQSRDGPRGGRHRHRAADTPAAAARRAAEPGAPAPVARHRGRARADPGIAGPHPGPGGPGAGPGPRRLASQR